MKRLIVLFAAVAVLAPSVARAGDWHHSLLDAVASDVAGHPSYVYCEDSWPEWYYFGFSQNVGGVTAPGRTLWVFVNPRQCETLQALANHEDVGSYYAASALLTLVHEAVHQRGGVYANPADPAVEGLTDCTAIPLIPSIVSRFFGIPATISQSYSVTLSKRVKGKLVRWVEIRFRQVPNPWMSMLVRDVLRWHRIKPAQYQGNC